MAADKAAVLAALEGAGYSAVGILRGASVALRNDVDVVRVAVAQVVKEERLAATYSRRGSYCYVACSCPRL